MGIVQGILRVDGRPGARNHIIAESKTILGLKVANLKEIVTS